MTTLELRNVPQEFVCPLTLEVMTNPVVNRLGNCYEKTALVEWLAQPNATCPLTRQPIRLSDLILDVKLQRKIRLWRTNEGDHTDAKGQELTDSSTTDDFDSIDSYLFVRAPSLLYEQPPSAARQRKRNFWRKLMMRGAFDGR